ncbi:hypothetical protein B0H16DRAFT_1822009 [Mycena metata]|uniref:Alfy-like armadillo-like repeat domain-containing protein n=1 Tax=Mycena metata TaxID=1033252 RepID=A0AAD7H0S2_9AGAR|nr:hypothetical protein B0H16DRAFT_1822009 [Mycena metata]
MGLLLSFAFRNFSLSGAFKSLRSAPSADVETTAREIVSRLGTIKRPGAMALLCRLADQFLIRDDTAMRYAVLKLYELLSATTHRYHVVFSSFALAESLLRRFIATAPDALERSVLQKLLRRLLDMGATPAVARLLFQAVVRADQTLDAELLEVIRYAMKSRWLEHFSMESPASMALTEEGVKGLPVPGFTFMVISKSDLGMDQGAAGDDSPDLLCTAGVGARACHAEWGDGKLELSTTSSREVGVFRKSSIHKMRWTHITLVHYPTRSANPTIRLYIDGVLNDGLNWNYPKSESTAQAVTYILGDDTKKTRMSWCVASAHLMAFPFGGDLPRFIHHLGPRYSGNFQDPLLVKFLTYEASTSLNMYLSTVVSKTAAASPSPALAAAPALMKVVRDGLGIAENSIIFSVSPLNCPPNEPEAAIVPANGNGANANGTVNGVGGAAKKAPRAFVTKGDVFIVKAACLDTSLWKIGGAAVPLRLLQVANTPHEVSRVLGVLVDGLRNSWQNSEDMERLRGYEILANVLRPKAQMVNMTGFETIFEFLGFNFRSPEHSTVVNAVAYRAIALDFELWARTRQEVQRVHLEHFTTLLLASRYKKFNAKQRFTKFGVVRKLLFALQTNWYQPEVVPFVVDALKSAAQSSFLACCYAQFPNMKSLYSR